MTTFATLCVNELRRLGCKVSTIIGHDPKHGEFRYGITLPEGVDKDVVGKRLLTDLGAIIRRTSGVGTTGRVYVSVPRVPVGAEFPLGSAKRRTEILRHNREACDLLTEVARRIKAWGEPPPPSEPEVFERPEETLSITAANGVRFLVRILRPGMRYGVTGALTWGNGTGVEFYDTRHPFTRFGQFTGRYYAYSLTYRQGGGLDLGSSEAWTIDAATMDLVRKWLRHEQ